MKEKDFERIRGIKERIDKATKGKWRVEKFYMAEPYEEFIEKAFVMNKNSIITANNWSNPYLEDLEFIAHAREDIPYLLKKIEETYQKGFNDGANTAATDILSNV